LRSVTEVPDKGALDDLLRDYYGVIVRKLALAGVPPNYTAEGLKTSFWPNIDKFLPPSGRLILVHDDAGRLVGCGTLQQVRADAGEVKRIYVRPEASGHGLGRAIVDARIQAARQLGWRRILVNAIRGNQDMLRIYQSLGFKFIDRYPECSDPIEVDPYFVYMQLELA
jgi:GNAT superfamily N-acetyltransferase